MTDGGEPRDDDRDDRDGSRSGDGPRSDDGDRDGGEEVGWTAPDDADGDDDLTELDPEGVEVDVDPGLDAGVDSESPFAELDADVESDDPFSDLDGGADEEGSGTDPFEQMEVGDLDEDVWEALSEEEASVGPAPAAEGGVGATPVEEDEEGGDHADHIVDKRQYCQSCPYLADPPAVACEHEGTEIVEVTDEDHFRVRGCPMIAEEGPQFDRG
ncbi:hypothetical protein [Haloparvum sedimenti]|uniref:hypothetical protein n=1 Tax=Haloparvum sedimenti TaxID=1678448 RepID=UPI00071E94E5|nr:hypothetical protein [Haloparvum sedimenti]